MLTIAQRITFAAEALASIQGRTSDQVVAQLLGNQVRSQIEQLGLLEQELHRVRQVRPIGKVLPSV